MIEEIKAQRQLEIVNGENLCTAYPLYIVYDEIYSVSEHDSSYSNGTSVFGKQEQYVRHDWEGNEIDATDNCDWDNLFETDDEKWSEVIKKSFHDKFITICFTRKAAEQFIKEERHNLKNPQIYVEYAERRNYELRSVLKLLGDD